MHEHDETSSSQRAMAVALQALQDAIEDQGGTLLEAMILVHVDGMDVTGTVAAHGIELDEALSFLLAHARGVADQTGYVLHVGMVKGGEG